jgi:tripartite-type tricarboxylate transporter receptor subunit TctC
MAINSSSATAALMPGVKRSPRSRRTTRLPISRRSGSSSRHRAIITPKNFPANTLPDFIAYVKANQNTVKYGSAGAGSASHVSCILLNAALGVDIVHVPIADLQDLIAGRIDYMCDSPSTE